MLSRYIFNVFILALLMALTSESYAQQENKKDIPGGFKYQAQHWVN